MKQMIIEGRNRIEFLVGCGRNIPQVASELGRSPSNQVTLHPLHLGQKYQKAVGRAILRKNGVSPAPKAESKK